MTVRAVDMIDDIRQATAELEAEGAPVPGDDLMRELAVLFRLSRTPVPLQQPADGDTAGIGGDAPPAGPDADCR